ncbi:MAG: hypothetical protein IPO56_17070 [Flavobacteriales bacterium]|nr:hypothetical protein [Flavobacteriales bacterium]
MIERVLLSLVSISLWASLLSAQTTVLFLGNSYTAANDLPNTFSAVGTFTWRRSQGECIHSRRLHLRNNTPPTRHRYRRSTRSPGTSVVMQEQSQLGALPRGCH